MKDLQKYYQQGVIMLKNGYGIELGKIIDVSVNYGAKRRWGQTERVHLGGKTVYKINISNKLLADDVDDKSLMDTIVHELLHTVDGCFCHTGKWKMLADRITATSNLTIKRTTSNEEKNIEREPYLYICKCEKCGKEIGRYKMSDFVKRAELYTHRNCGGHFKRIK